MAQKEKSLNAVGILGDMALTVVAVAVVGITFMGVSGLTPKTTKTLTEKEQAVLGVSTKQQEVSYFPISTETLPFVKNSTISGSTDLSGNAAVTIHFNPLEASTYEFKTVTIKNTSLEYKKIQLTPSFSLEGSYTSIKMTYAGQITEIVSTNGTTTALDLIVPPSSASDFSLTVQPTTKLATPVTLTLDFTEIR